MAIDHEKPLAPNVKGQPDYRPKRRVNLIGAGWNGKDWSQWEMDEINHIQYRVTYHNCPLFDGTETPMLIECAMVTWEEYKCPKNS